MAIGSQWGLGVGLHLCRGEGRAVFWICQAFHQMLLELTCGPSLEDIATWAHRQEPARI